MCAPCFQREKPRERVISFDATRGALQSRWAAEGFLDNVMRDPGGKTLHVLQSHLDGHNRARMVAVAAESPMSDAALTKAIQEYRSGHAIYELDAGTFAREMGMFFSLADP